MNKNKAIVVDMVGGPGTLKSALASGVFFMLKLHGVSCELVGEFAKSLTWGKQYDLLADQGYVFKNQRLLLDNVVDHVDVVIVDTSLLLSLVYNRDITSDEFKQHVLDTYNTYNNLTINLIRATDIDYEECGRNQCLSEASGIDLVVQNLLEDNGIKHTSIDAGPYAVNVITKQILEAMSDDLKIAVKFKSV